jgi:hypothetical protein
MAKEPTLVKLLDGPRKNLREIPPCTQPEQQRRCSVFTYSPSRESREQNTKPKKKNNKKNNNNKTQPQTNTPPGLNTQ